MGRVTAFLAIVLLAACHSGPEQKADPGPKLQAFEFLGCSGDHNDGPSKPQVWRISGVDRVTFLTRTVNSCGLSGRNPRVKFRSGVLDLTYEIDCAGIPLTLRFGSESDDEWNVEARARDTGDVNVVKCSAKTRSEALAAALEGFNAGAIANGGKPVDAEAVAKVMRDVRAI